MLIKKSTTLRVTRLIGFFFKLTVKNDKTPMRINQRETVYTCKENLSKDEKYVFCLSIKYIMYR